MGAVWRARDLRTGSWVAVKVLGRHEGVGAALLLRFVHEQSVRIQHRHIVAPSGWAAEDDIVVLTMDLVRGGSVETLLLEHGALPQPYVAALLDQTLQALTAVHTAGIVHRDVKPANLLLDATGSGPPRLRLADFGVAASAAEAQLGPTIGAIGTDGYMSPEQLRGDTPHPRQDVYAAGVTAIRLLTGHLLTHRLTRSDQGAPPGQLRSLLDQMTDPDPQRRTPDARTALHHLRRLGLTGTPETGADRPFVPDRLGPPPSRWRRPLLG